MKKLLRTKKQRKTEELLQGKAGKAAGAKKKE
jgi:hypothetical protein